MLHDWGYARRQDRHERERLLRWPGRSYPTFDDELPLEWLLDEMRALWRALRRPLSRRLARRARRQMLLLPARLITAAIVEGQVVRLCGQIAVVAPTTAAGTWAEIERMVEAGGALPDFSVLLADGTSVAVATEEAAAHGKLHVLDLWEDRQSHATCDERISPLFRRTRFRPGQPVEVCGLATRTIALDQASAGYRGTGLQWRMVAAEASLSILFSAPAVTPRPDR